MTRQEVCRLFNIQGTPVAGEIPRILLLMPARHYRIAVAGKGMDTEHAWMNWETPVSQNIPIWDDVQSVRNAEIRMYFEQKQEVKNQKMEENSHGSYCRCRFTKRQTC